MRDSGFAGLGEWLQFTQVVSAGDSRNQPPDPNPLDSLPSLSVHDPHPLVRPVFLVSLSKTAQRKGPHGETHRIPSGMKFMLKRELKLPGEEQRKVCLWKLSPS